MVVVGLGFFFFGFDYGLVCLEDFLFVFEGGCGVFGGEVVEVGFVNGFVWIVEVVFLGFGLVDEEILVGVVFEVDVVG